MFMKFAKTSGFSSADSQKLSDNFWDVSFHCFLDAFASYFVGAVKKKDAKSQKSATKIALSLISEITFCT